MFFLNPLYLVIMGDQTDDTDDLILSLLAKNDPKAASLMFNAHYKALHNSVKKITRNSEDSQDIVLQLFEAVWHKRHSLNITKPIRSYLLTAVRNRAINHIRNNGRTKALLNHVIHLSATTRTVPPVDIEIQGRELKNIIKAAIAMLPYKTRITFIMSRNYGMTYREIAARLGVSEKAVEKNMNRALRLLRILLKPYLNILLVLV